MKTWETRQKKIIFSQRHRCKHAARKPLSKEKKYYKLHLFNILNVSPRQQWDQTESKWSPEFSHEKRNPVISHVSSGYSQEISTKWNSVSKQVSTFHPINQTVSPAPKLTWLAESEVGMSCHSIRSMFQWLWTWNWHNTLPEHLNITNFIFKATAQQTLVWQQHRVPGQK